MIKLLLQCKFRLSRLFTVVILLAILAAVGLLAYTIAAPQQGENFTAFYILGINGTADCYPTQFTIDEVEVTAVGYTCAGETQQVEENSGRVTLGIVNREHADVDYEVEIKLGDVVLEELGPVTLSHEEKWEQGAGFAPTSVGQDQKVEFLLYKDYMAEPYSSLHLWIDVSQAQP